MKNFLLITLCFTYSASVLSLWCYSCDSTDFEFDRYQDCDSHLIHMSKEDCSEYNDYGNTEDPENSDSEEDDIPLNYVCYRAVYFHKDDGYVIMRGCEEENVCEDLKNSTDNLGDRPKAIPIECRVCSEDFCDPREYSGIECMHEDCHPLEPDYDTCGEEDFGIPRPWEPPTESDYESSECESD